MAAASAVRDDKASSFGSDIDVTGVDPSTIGNVYDFRWEKGSDNVLLSLGFDGAIVRNQFADDHNLEVGGKFSIQTPQGKKVPLVVRGIYDPPAEQLDALLGAVTLAQRAFDTHFPRPKDLFVFVDTDDGVTSQATAALDKTLDPYPDAVVRTNSAWITERAGGIDMILNVFYVLLALSIIVSLFGMVNALALSVFERTRELGMLRAIGLTRRQTRRMIRYESVIIALIGAALGLPLGHPARRGHHQGAGQPGRHVLAPARGGRGVRDRRDAGRHAGGDPARPAGVAAERAEGAAVRVDGHPSLATGRRRTPAAGASARSSGLRSA